MDPRRALELAEGSRAELLALLEALIEVPSPYGASGWEAQERLGEYLERNGFVVETGEDPWEPLRDHPEFSPPPPEIETPVNLVATPPDGPPLTFFAHVDTETPSAGWSSPPAVATVRDGRVYGLGAADDKGGLAAMAVAAALLARDSGTAPRVASVHGKGGGARGTLPVFARMEAGDSVYVHPPENGAGLGVLKSASRGVVDVHLRVTGWSGRPREIGTPGSAPFAEGGDALEACLRWVERLRQGELSDCEVNLGRLVAGEAAGLTPVRCEAEVRVLFRGKRTVRGVLEAFRRAAEDQPARGSGGRFGYEATAPELRANPAETAWSDPLAAELRSAVAGIIGREPVPYADHLASDIRFPIRLQGAASLGIGSQGGNFYGPDEWVDLDDLVRLVGVLVLFGARR
ncbi:MAG: M20/M25/M40 family metallo-hydrolase [Acidobacteria bacterium]|nr:M20/M25/M40 family metallo-hydrolase [Acidobacteriota bacterium]MYH23310.1 M20/M25/M40 family metallo-hydrolase [Acidobacteriota bacterium]MYK79133.1 M20/M25/M40 family metallo-hydrolase [Acidobacteriota bacterium]